MIYGVFGKPRSGKSTFLARFVFRVLRARKLAQLPFFGRFFKHSKYYYHVIYSTEPMIGCTTISPYDIGTFEPEGVRFNERSLFVIHEAGCCFNNRNHKNIPDYCTDFFAQHGHYLSDIIYDSQSVDIDKKLRNRTQSFFVVSKCPVRRWRSKVTKVKYWIGVNSEAKKLDECYTEPMGFFEMIFARLTKQVYTFNRCPYYRYFDSYSKNLNLPQWHGSPPPDSPMSDFSAWVYIIGRFLFALSVVSLIIAIFLAVV